MLSPEEEKVICCCPKTSCTFDLFSEIFLHQPGAIAGNSEENRRNQPPNTWCQCHLVLSNRVIKQQRGETFRGEAIQASSHFTECYHLISLSACPKLDRILFLGNRRKWISSVGSHHTALLAKALKVIGTSTACLKSPPHQRKKRAF